MERHNAFAKLLAPAALLTIVCGFAATPALASTSVRFKQVQNLIVASVTVNGAGPFDFIFDTGASSTIIDHDLAKQLSLSPTESSSVLTVAGSKTVPRYRLDRLALGPKSAQNLTVLCTELRDIHAISSKLHGVLGQNFLSGFDYILNYRNQLIEFEENGEFANSLQGARLAVERDRGRFIVITQPSSPQKHAFKLVLDSGASCIVVFRAALNNADIEIDLDVTDPITVWTAVGGQRVLTGRIRKLQIGNEKFSALPVRVVDNRAAIEGRPENGLVPTSLFRSIYFNNTENFVILNPRASEQR